MSGPQRRFDPAELREPGEPDPSVAELADALAAARELEALASEAGIRPSDGFEDRVMAAIAAEPAPRLVAAPVSAVRGGRLGAFLVTIRESWAVAFSGWSTDGRPGPGARVRAPGRAGHGSAGRRLGRDRRCADRTERGDRPTGRHHQPDDAVR